MLNDSDFVVILDYKGNVSRNAGAIQRHELYGRTLSSMTNGKTRLLILGNFQGKNVLNEISDLELISFPNASRFKPVFIALSVKTLWSYRQSIKIIVSGDPWMTLVVAKIIRRLLKVRIHLQVQLHGDFFSSAWKGLRLRNRMASYFLPTLLKNCESIRVVSSRQAQDLVDSCNIEVNRIVCVPLPLNVPTLPRNNSRHKGMPLTFVGRLEEERGLKNLLYLVELIPEALAVSPLILNDANSPIKITPSKSRSPIITCASNISDNLNFSSRFSIEKLLRRTQDSEYLNLILNGTPNTFVSLDSGS